MSHHLPISRCETGYICYSWVLNIVRLLSWRRQVLQTRQVREGVVTPIGFWLSTSMCLSIDRWTNVKVECDPSWQPFQGHCYRLQAEKRSWQESKRACLRGGGDLLSIHSMAELEFITKQIKQGEGLPGFSTGWRRGYVCMSNPFLPRKHKRIFPSLLVRGRPQCLLPFFPALLYPRGGGAMDWPQ